VSRRIRRIGRLFRREPTHAAPNVTITRWNAPAARAVDQNREI
jgi:hypothetical protein